jgi:hypothetical protein
VKEGTHQSENAGLSFLDLRTLSKTETDGVVILQSTSS